MRDAMELAEALINVFDFGAEYATNVNLNDWKRNNTTITLTADGQPFTIEVQDPSKPKSIQEIVNESAKEHELAGNEYEAAGNSEGARYLRYVSNLLYAIGRGVQDPSPILPRSKKG